jgi:hypothetical protein
MKIFPLLFICLFALLVPVAAQYPPDKNPDTFHLGAKTVRIPPPENFTDVIGLIRNDNGRFAPDEPGGLLSLAVPDKVIDRLAATPLMQLDIYTKARIEPSIRTTEISPDLYASVVSEFQKNFTTLFDPKGKIVNDARQEIKDFVTRVSGNKSKVEVAPVRNLGYFQKTENTFSALMLMTIEVNGTRIPMLVTVSLLRINDRLINAAVYKRLPTEQDFTLIPEFTKKWTTAILTANK